MDHQRFDELTLILSASTARRRAVWALVGGVLASASYQINPEVVASTCSSRGEFCHNSKDCCRKLVCLFKECDHCLGRGEHCKDDPDCCSGNCKHRNCT